MTDLSPLLSPSSIAIIGASGDPATLRGRILEFLFQRNYPGKLHLVTPGHAEIRGIRTVKTVSEIKEPIDVVLLAVPADRAEPVLRECAAAGAKFAVCFSSGFAEEGEAGAERQQNLARLAKETGMRIVGPNTAGYFNVTGMVPMTFTRTADASKGSPRGQARPGPVAVVSQSGGLGFALQHRAAMQHGLGFSCLVSSGNEADLESLDFVEHLLADSHTRVIMLLIESFKHPARLAEVAAHARAAGKPLLVTKIGRTEAGARAADSHAARLTGSDTGYAAAFRRYGILRTDDEEEMCDLAAAFSRSPLPAGNRVGIVTTSGGTGVLMADACEMTGLKVPLLDEATQKALSAHVPSFGSTVNPIDVTAQVSINPMGHGTGKMSPLVGTLAVLAASDAVDAIVLVVNLSDGDVLLREKQYLSAFAATLKKPLLVYTHAQASEDSLDLLWGMGLSCFGSTRRTARVLQMMLEYSRILAAAVDVSAPAPKIGKAPPVTLGELCEYQAKALLRDYGMATPREQLAESVEEAVTVAKALGGKVALKIQSPQIQHKTEAGGVMLGLNSPEAVRAGYGQLMTRARSYDAKAYIHGVLVQEMTHPGLEMAIGIVRDPDFGPMMMAGLGGIHIEVLKDVAWELLPVRKATALAMLQRLRGYPLLEGVRGQPRRDIEALAVLMEQVSLVVEHCGDLIAQVDLNPVFVQEAGGGVQIIDAMILGRDRIS